ncbi:hypothetical protein CHS0354_022679 [Potamilus streckersoni]|uniref:Uncharacterized protein n=1 Tax=Potamilus streckersoni TaxID=2493646 RepID=A0AAE0VRK8_9BIVA|nr:hypothetical protein CHS0354_022679 [Potamilus streckersoni]
MGYSNIGVSGGSIRARMHRHNFVFEFEVYRGIIPTGYLEITGKKFNNRLDNLLIVKQRENYRRGCLGRCGVNFGRVCAVIITRLYAKEQIEYRSLYQEAESLEISPERLTCVL